MLLAALFVLVPAAVASADPQYPPTTVTTTPPPSTRVPPPEKQVPPPGRPGLAVTGSESTPLVWAGVAALAVGGVLVVGARRRATVRR
jgi:LPXTG-motif cell wall-anchored protein